MVSSESGAQPDAEARTDGGAAEAAVCAADAAATSAGEVAVEAGGVASTPQEEGQGESAASIDEATARKLLGDGAAFEQLAQDGRAPREAFVREFAGQLAEQACDACVAGDEAALRELVASGMDVNQAGDHRGCPPLCGAAQEGQAKCLAMLLRVAEIDVNKAETDGSTPLFWPR